MNSSGTVFEPGKTQQVLVSPALNVAHSHQTNPDPQWLRLARETAQCAIEINPDLAAAREALGFVHFEVGQFFFARSRYADAAAEREAVRTLTPDNVLVLRNLSAACYSLGRYDEAASIRQRALEVQPSAPKELDNEPELTSLRADARYHRLLDDARR